MMPWLLGILFCCWPLGQDQRGVLEQASTNYQAGRFAQAEALFLQALEQPDLDRGALLYNLGNCMFRQGSFGEAMLYYRRASLHRPTDLALLANLALLRQKLGLREEGASEYLLRDLAALSPTLLLGLGTLIQLGVLFAWFYLPRERLSRKLLVVLLLLGMGLHARVIQQQFEARTFPAMVLEKRTGLFQDPHEELRPLFRLGIGESLRVFEASDRWARVAHARGQGWVLLQNLALILD